LTLSLPGLRLRVFLIVWLLSIGVVGIEVVRRNFDIGLFLVASITGFLVGRNWLFGYWVQASDLMGFTLCFTAGTMIGRVGATRRGIRLVLYAVSVISSEEPGSSQS